MKFNQRGFLLTTLAGTVLVGSQLLMPLAHAATSASPGASSKTSSTLSSRVSLISRVDKVPYSVRLEDQLLAYLRYLPLQFVVKGTTSVPTTTTTSSTTSTTTSTTTTTTTVPSSTSSTTSTTTTTTIPPVKAILIATKIVAGTFSWRYNSLPGALKSLWSVGSNNVVLQGAVMRFQNVHNLLTTGAIDPTTWHAIVTAAIQKNLDPQPYTNVLVSQTVPQSLKLYVNGHVFFSTLVNTGITTDPTQNGTYPVYLRYTVTTMSGTNPNGSHYHDTGIPWVSYFHGGDALHGFLRSQYGYPQSLGCVEMTYAHAGIVWPHTPIGTLVSVV